MFCISEIQDACFIPWGTFSKNTLSHNVNQKIHPGIRPFFPDPLQKLTGYILGWDASSLQVSRKSVRNFLWNPADKPGNEHKTSLCYCVVTFNYSSVFMVHLIPRGCHTGKCLRWATQGMECRFTNFHAKLLLNTLHFLVLWTHNFSLSCHAFLIQLSRGTMWVLGSSGPLVSVWRVHQSPLEMMFLCETCNISVFPCVFSICSPFLVFIYLHYLWSCDILKI